MKWIETRPLILRGSEQEQPPSHVRFAGIYPAQCQIIGTEIERDGVRDLSRAPRVIPLGYRAKIEVPRASRELPYAKAEHTRQEQTGAARPRWEFPHHTRAGSGVKRPLEFPRQDM